MATSSTLVTINVSPTINAAGDSYTTPTGTPVNCPVLANDVVNGLPATLTTLSAAPQVTVPPTHGTVEWDGTQFVYTPEEGFCGADTFEYEIARVCASCFCVVWLQHSGVDWRWSWVNYGMPALFSAEAPVTATWSGGCITFVYTGSEPAGAWWYATPPAEGCAGVTAVPAEGETITLTQGDTVAVVRSCSAQGLYFDILWMSGWKWMVYGGPAGELDAGASVTVVHLGETYTAVYDGNTWAANWVGDTPPLPPVTGMLVPSDAITVDGDSYCGGIRQAETQPQPPDSDAPVFFSFTAAVDENSGAVGVAASTPPTPEDFGTLLPPGMATMPGVNFVGVRVMAPFAGMVEFYVDSADDYAGRTLAIYAADDDTLLGYARMHPTGELHVMAAVGAIAITAGETYYATLTPPPGP